MTVVDAVTPLLASPAFWLAVMGLALATVPAALFAVNLPVFRPPPKPRGAQDREADLAAVSVLIPARDEEDVIGPAVRSVLANRGVELELIVLDDGSEDATATIVEEIAASDPRLRLESAPPLPTGWCGKQHACAVLAEHASHPVRVFLDADVRLAPEALARIAASLETSGAGLVSGFPRQETGTWAEKLLIPLIHFVLLGFLPLRAMRRSASPAYGAACGQLVAVRADAYDQVGGHRAIRRSLHDGLHLPRLFRRRGWTTDLFDATDLAVCRMYGDARQVFAGLAKNAHEGLGSPGTILVWTLLLGGGQVLPFAMLAAVALGWVGTAVAPAVLALSAPGALLVWGARAVAARRFRQPWLGVVLHPLGVATLLGIQWWALGRHLAGRPASWKGRSYRVGEV